MPRDNEVESWKLVQGPVVVKTEADLVQWIEGDAPKYIELGWVSSVYAQYRKGDERLQVAVHDMETPTKAEALYLEHFPGATAAIPIPVPAGLPSNAIIDKGLAPDSYAAYASSHQFFIELNIDAKTDAALEDLRSFVLAMLERAR